MPALSAWEKLSASSIPAAMSPSMTCYGTTISQELRSMPILIPLKPTGGNCDASPPAFSLWRNDIFCSDPSRFLFHMRGFHWTLTDAKALDLMSFVSLKASPGLAVVRCSEDRRKKRRKPVKASSSLVRTAALVSKSLSVGGVSYLMV